MKVFLIEIVGGTPEIKKKIRKTAEETPRKALEEISVISTKKLLKKSWGEHRENSRKIIFENPEQPKVRIKMHIRTETEGIRIAFYYLPRH